MSAHRVSQDADAVAVLLDERSSVALVLELDGELGLVAHVCSPFGSLVCIMTGSVKPV
jgi:hypothetical protein